MLFLSSMVRSNCRRLPVTLLDRLATLVLVAVAILAAAPTTGVCRVESPRGPNIVLIVADDLGYGELGCYGQQKIRTPNIDRLAAEGMRFAQHYCGNAVCAPSRCSLMTGKHPGHAYIRDNQKARLPAGLVQRYGFDFTGQEPIPEAEVTLAEVLQSKGYATAAIGKWGLGQFGTTGDPNRQGFELFFGYNCQSHAHSYYPAYLWRNDQKVKLGNDPPIPGHALFPAGANPDDPAAYKAFQGTDYTPDRMIEEALTFVRQHREGPFFLYFPSTLPHLALQIPEEELKPYLGQWEETPFVGKGYTPQRTPRAAYAAMISRLDSDVGRLMALLDELHLADNTLVLFTSDNGTTHVREEVDYEFFQSVGPLRGLKGSLYEGGIRVPMIARWPGKIQPATTTEHVAAFWDVLPTLAEVAGAETPQGIDGISYAPTLLGQPDQQRKHDCLYWEFTGYGGQQAARLGDWKAVRQNMLRRDNPDPLAIELYNLREDLGESRNVAAEHPEIVARLRDIMKAEHVPSELFPLRLIDRE